MRVARDAVDILYLSQGNASSLRYRYLPRTRFSNVHQHELRPQLGQSDFKGVFNPKSRSHVYSSPVASNRGSQAPKSSPSLPIDASSFVNRECGVRSLSRTECPEGKLWILLLGDDEYEGEDGSQYVLSEVQSPEETPIIEEGNYVALQFVATNTECSGGKTLKFNGELLGIPVVVVVDSGATHNFVSRQLVIALGMPSHDFHGINIKLDDGT